MSQPTEKNDPRVTPPKKYVGNAEVDPKTGGLRDDLADSSGSRDQNDDLDSQDLDAGADDVGADDAGDDGDEDQSVKSTPRRTPKEGRNPSSRGR
jgi:hypothetical protein